MGLPSWLQAEGMPGGATHGKKGAGPDAGASLRPFEGLSGASELTDDAEFTRQPVGSLSQLVAKSPRFHGRYRHCVVRQHDKGTDD